MQISEHGLEFIAGFEGYRYHAYWDPYGHCWTVGIGETHDVGPNTTMTYQQALEDLKTRLASSYEPAISALGVPLNQNQWDALCSFVWNLGPGSMDWDVGRYLRAREYDAAANAMLGYDRAGGVVLAGLVARRHAERTLFLTPVTPPAPKPSYHYGRYRPGGERTAAERYDYWRERQGVHHPGRPLMLIRERQCALYARRIELAVGDDARHGRQDPWGSDDRRFRHSQLKIRAHGERVEPSL